MKEADEYGHHSFELDHVKKDGSVFPCLVDMTAVKDQNGKNDLSGKQCAGHHGTQTF